MYHRSVILRLTLSFCMAFVIAVAAFADTIRLKDGSIIKGRITGFSGGKFTVAIGEGSRRRQMSFDASEIQAIEFDRDSVRPETTVARRSEDEDDDDPIVVEAEPKPSVPSVIKTGTGSTPARTNPPPVASRPSQNASAVKPIELNLKVLADNTANGWTNSGWVVKKGQRIRIIGGGEVSLGRGRKTGPSGSAELEDEQKLMKSVPTGALIAVIGDDNNDFIYVGAEREFTASRDGALFLGLNEGNLNDNTGSYEVRVEILPDTGE